MDDSQRYEKKVETAVLTGLTDEQSAEAKTYIHRLVQDWIQQADEDRSLKRNDLVEIGLADLQGILTGKGGAERVAALQFQALKRQVQQTAGRAFDLATQVVDQKTTKPRAAKEALGLQERIHKLMQEVKLLKDEESRRILMRNLADADLEVRYVLEDEQGAISIRLNRYINR